MSRRLEIELTSQRADGTWTWRAAGARQPKGEVRADLVPDAAAVGTVLKAEADGGLDGLEITAVFAPRVRSVPADRLELITGGDGPLVTTTLARKSRRGDRSDRRGPDGDRSRGRPRKDARDDRGHRTRRRRDEESPGDDSERKNRKPRRSDDSTKRSRRDDSDSGTDRRGQRSDRRGQRSGDRRSQDGKRSDRPARPRGPGLKAKRIHRQAALKALPEDQQFLAREVLRAGVPGVRKSVERMNAKAAAESLPQIKSEPILALAEQLAPVLKAAEWRDRADAALAGIARIDLRDIRSVIAAADRAARTEETRALAESLRAGLAQRLEVDQRKWLDELANTIAEGRTIRALRLSSRPPKAGTPLPVDMAERLANMAAADLNPTANHQRWSTVVDSVAVSPVRTQVIPLGVPDKPSEDLLTTVRRLSDRVPQIAALFGIEPQPPSRGGRLPPPPPPAAEVVEQAEQPPDTKTGSDTPAAAQEPPPDTEAPTGREDA
ncbi:MAG: hypothetical protein OXC00_09975 [Acidimicrobiaceae bacterium]|nr:hypothetical protein [Acidimicrobiaceae bacterium]